MCGSQRERLTEIKNEYNLGDKMPKFLVEESEQSEVPPTEGNSESADKGGEFCEGYVDGLGSHQNGFQCPTSWSDGSETENIYCCGTSTIKYCCDEPGNTLRLAHVGAIIGGMFGVVLLVLVCILLCCCFCSCCFCSRSRRRTPRRRCHRQLPSPKPTTAIARATQIAMTVTNGHANARYPKQMTAAFPPPVPSQPPPHTNCPVVPAAAAAAAHYPSPTNGYPQQPAYAPQLTPVHQMHPHQMHTQYHPQTPMDQFNPHTQSPMNYSPHPQHYSPHHQYPPQQFGVPMPQPPPYSPEAEAPPLLDKGMAFPPAATSGPSAPPPGDPEYPQKH